MEDGRIPKDMPYGELEVGKRKTVWPLLRYKDACKHDMKAFNIRHETLEELASDRAIWKAALHFGSLSCEQKRRERWQRRHQQRQNRR